MLWMHIMSECTFACAGSDAIPCEHFTCARLCVQQTLQAGTSEKSPSTTPRPREQHIAISSADCAHTHAHADVANAATESTDNSVANYCYGLTRDAHVMALHLPAQFPHARIDDITHAHTQTDTRARTRMCIRIVIASPEMIYLYCLTRNPTQTDQCSGAGTKRIYGETAWLWWKTCNSQIDNMNERFFININYFIFINTLHLK